MSVVSSISRASGSGGVLLEFDELYATDPDDLWQAVTTPERLSRWMAPYLGDFRLGGRWQAIGSDGDVYCEGEVTACDAPRGFATTWQVRGERPTELVVRLEPEGAGTRLRLRHRGVTTIGYGAGWHVYLETLHQYLTAGADAAVRDSDAWDARFAELAPQYAQRFRALGADPAASAADAGADPAASVTEADAG
jgi:uncharacterized protein YndB with AHSA1/START domain